MFCPMSKWAMPSGRRWSALEKEPPPFSQKPWIVIRGATFRSRHANAVEAQEQAFCSLSRHVIQPLKKAYALSSVHVHLCVRPHKGNKQIIENAEKYFGIARSDVSLREVSREEQSLQQGQYRTCFEDVPNDAGFALVLRPDLVFKENLNFTRAMSPNLFYFQWNLFQACMNREVADQIHLVGGNLIKDFKEKWDGAKMGAPAEGLPYYDTFHMMYNWAEKAFGRERLDFLNHYPPENCLSPSTEYNWMKHGFCRQRGNPGDHETRVGVPAFGNLTNPLFDYDRHVDADSLSLCEWDEGRAVGKARRSSQEASEAA